MASNPVDNFNSGPESDKQRFANLIIRHEGLVPLQTPFRITDDSMRRWVSMFDDTLKVALDPNAKKPKGRENFLFLKNQADLLPAVMEQFRLYAFRNPNITIGDAVRVFDQTGSKGKLKFLREQGFPEEQTLAELF